MRYGPEPPSLTRRAAVDVLAPAPRRISPAPRPRISVQFAAPRGPRLPTRARQTLAWSAAAYLALQFVASVVIDSAEGVRDVMFAQRMAFLGERQAVHPDQPLLLALGSSRFAYGFRPDAMGEPPQAPRTFNLGMVRANPLYQRIFLDRLLAAGIHPRWLLLEIHPMLLHAAPYEAGRQHCPETERCSAREVWLLSRYLDRPLALWSEWLGSRLAGCYWHRAELLRHGAPRWATARTRHPFGFDRPDSLGWARGPWRTCTDEQRRENLALSLETFEPALRDFHVGDGPRRALRDILQLCRQERIEVCLCLMPEAAGLRDSYSPEARREIEACIAELRSEFGLPLIDATRWCADERFVDGEHLLPSGAAAFSERLAREALRPWMAGL